MTPAERYDILTKFAENKKEGLDNKAAAEKLGMGIPFITLYTWIRNGLWKDADHTKPPVRLKVRHNRTRPSTRPTRTARLRNLSKKSKPASKPAAEEVAKPKTILRKAKPVSDAPAATQPVRAPTKSSEPRITVRLPSGVEFYFMSVPDAREFAESLKKD